jgi:GNAT superfamily N-acetyltransferase
MPDIEIMPVTRDAWDEMRDTGALAPLLEASQAENFNMVRRLCDNWESGANRFDGKGEALFAAWRGEKNLLGLGGRSCDPYLKDPEVLRVRHVYVLPGWRRKGVGSLLMRKILDIPRKGYKKITLRAPETACAFYEHLGFSRVGEGDVTHELEI